MNVSVRSVLCVTMKKLYVVQGEENFSLKAKTHCHDSLNLRSEIEREIDRERKNIA